MDPSGAYFGWKATAIGSNFVNAKQHLEKRYSEDLELEDAVHTALQTMKEGFEGEVRACACPRSLPSLTHPGAATDERLQH